MVRGAGSGRSRAADFHALRIGSAREAQQQRKRLRAQGLRGCDERGQSSGRREKAREITSRLKCLSHCAKKSRVTNESSEK
jgi:hypothetical protein